VATFAVDPGPLAHAYAEACQRLDSMQAAAALWHARLDIWPDDADARRSIANRLGWLRALDVVEPELSRLRAFAASIHRDFGRVVLMGMGGSSLAPEVMRRVIGVAPGFPRFAMIDTVNADAVRAVFADPAPTAFVLASKSGTTIEPVSLAAEARRQSTASGSGWGPNVIAITDRDTALHREAIRDHFREVFINPSDIGGRYSALSLFGMVPAALMGADLDGLVAAARAMESACRRPKSAENAGLALGALMAAAAADRRDKLTLLMPPAFEAFGLWVEQLVAESTGKRGTGIVPVTGEPAAAAFAGDRCFVEITFAGQTADAGVLARARASGAPRVAIDVPRATDLGAEFLRWEVATAIAGLLLGVNPFDEPNVKQAKDATNELLSACQRDGRLPLPPAHATIDAARLTFSAASAGGSILDSVEPGDYLALLAYAPPEDDSWGTALAAARANLAESSGVATTAAYGPRYLHSTGQLHKGGPNTGVFVIVTTGVDADLPIPGRPYSFGTLEAAQAIGDFESLDRGGRRAVYVHLPRRDPRALAEVIAALSTRRVRATTAGSREPGTVG
jgi:glucose-6-phosphate isomerase